jgi:hypothetical protein
VDPSDKDQLGFGLRTVTNEEMGNRLTPLPFA